MLGLANPWAILIVLGLVASAGIAGYADGRDSGVNAQYKIDQTAIDKVNSELAANKAEAASKLKASYQLILSKNLENEALKSSYEKERQKNVENNRKLYNANAAIKLYVRALNPVGRDSSGGSVSNGPSSASNSGTTLVQLPDEVARNLHNLTFDCDSLSSDYKVLYDYAHNVCSKAP